MEFKPSFRKMPSDPLRFLAIRDMDTCPLILIRSSGVALYGNKPAEKDELIKLFDETCDLLLFAWTGNKKTDVFQIDKKALQTHYHNNVPTI